MDGLRATSLEKKKKEKTPLDQPTRGTVEKLFRELHENQWERYRNSITRKLEEEREELKKRLLDVPEYNRLQEKIEEAARIEQENYAQERQEVRRVSQLYRAHGLTDMVKSEIQKLVAWIYRQNKHKTQERNND